MRGLGLGLGISRRALLRGGVVSSLAAVTDLSISYDEETGTVTFSYTPPVGSVSEEYRLSQNDPPSDDGADALPPEGVEIELESNTTYYGQVRGVEANGARGPWSNVASLLTPYVFDDSDAQAAVARMSTEPVAAHKAAIDILFQRLKVGEINATDNLTDMLILVTAQKAGIGDQWINLIADANNPAVNAGAPTFAAADGSYTLDGTDDIIGTAFNPVTESLPQNTWGFAIESAEDIQENDAIGFNFDGTDGTSLAFRTTGNGTTFRANQAAVSTANNSVGIGRFYVNRSGASAAELYLDGVALTIGTVQASVAHNNAEWLLGHLNTTVRNGKIKGYAIWGASKSANRIADFEAAWAEYNAAFAAL